MTLLNNFFHGCEKYFFESQKIVMAIEVPTNKEIFGGGKNREGKGVGCSMYQRRRANTESIDLRKELGRVI